MTNSRTVDADALPQLRSLSEQWIERAWARTGQAVGAGMVPVGRFPLFDVGDFAFPFKNPPVECWMLQDGRLLRATSASISRVPYVAFSLDEAKMEMRIQLQWAPRCGYGYEVAFGPDGSTVKECMKWIS